MKNLRIQTLTFVLLAIFSLSTFQAEAQSNKGKQNAKRTGKNVNCNKQSRTQCKIPDLTAEQQKKIEDLKLKHKKKMNSRRNILAEKNARLNTLRSADNANMSEINKTIDEIGAIRTQMMKDKEAHYQSIRSLLNDKQKVYFDSKRHRGGDACRGGGKHRKGDRQANAQGCGNK